MKAYAGHSDSDLVSLLQKGDQLTFAAIYSRYWARLYFRAARKLGDEMEGQEAMQEIFFSHWKNREKLVLRGELEHYLAASVRYQVILRLARARRRAVAEEKLNLYC